MKTIEYNYEEKSKGNLYRGKPRGLYDPSATEVFMTKLGQEIYKYTDDNQHKTLMTDEDWNNHCTAADKCVRFGTLWGPKSLDAFSTEEQGIIKVFLDKRHDNKK